MKKKVVIEDICEFVTNGVTTQVGVAVWVGIRIECNTIQCNYPLPIHKHFYLLTFFFFFIQGLRLKFVFSTPNFKHAKSCPLILESMKLEYCVSSTRVH